VLDDAVVAFPCGDAFILNFSAGEDASILKLSLAMSSVKPVAPVPSSRRKFEAVLAPMGL